MEVFFVLWRHGTNLRKTWITTENQCAKRYEIITTPGEFREEMLWLVGLRCMCVYDGIKSAIHSRATHVSYMNVENLKIFLYPFWTMSSNKQCNACPKFWSKKKQNSRSIVELSFIYKNTWLLPKMGVSTLYKNVYVKIVHAHMCSPFLVEIWVWYLYIMLI